MHKVVNPAADPLDREHLSLTIVEGKFMTMGPLPKADASSINERKSIIALQNILPSERFVLRDERISDAGVDLSIELLVDGSYSNFRSQTQVKSCQKTNLNQDGSISYGIDSSNVNYIMNGPVGLYILFLEDTQQLRYEWAEDAYKERIGKSTKKSKNWFSVSTISIKFKKILNSQTIDDIYQKILSKGLMNRQISDIFARSQSDDISISIDKETLAVTDEDASILKSIDLIIKSGMYLVSCGYAKKIIEICENIPRDEFQKNNRLHLIQAYAYHSLSYFQKSLAKLEDFLIIDDITKKDEKFANKLKYANELSLGFITQDEYENQQKNPNATQDIEDDLNFLIQNFNKEKSSKQRDEILLRISRTVDEIKASDASDAFKLKAEIDLVTAAGFDAISKFFSSIFNAESRKNSISKNLMIVSIIEYEQSKTNYEKWRKETALLVKKAEKLKMPILWADAISSYVSIEYNFLFSEIIYSKLKSSERPPNNEEKILHLMESIEKAQKMYKNVGSIEGEMRSILYLADLFELKGQEQAATNLAQGIIRKLKIFKFQKITKWAQGHIDKDTIFAQQLKKATKMNDPEADEQDFANMNEEQISEYALHILDQFLLPDDRLSIVIFGIKFLQYAAQEKLNWCKYFEILEEKLHECSSKTFLSENPLRYIKCQKFLHKGKKGHDFVQLFSEFKDEYCSLCNCRCPLKKTS